MKEALESPKQQEIDRRTLLRKAVGITAGVLLLQHGVERGIKYNAAASPGYTPREIFIRYEGSEDKEENGAQVLRSKQPKSTEFEKNLTDKLKPF